MASCLFDAKPLSEPMLAYYWLNFSVKFETKYNNFNTTKMTPKMLPLKWQPFCVGLHMAKSWVKSNGNWFIPYMNHSLITTLEPLSHHATRQYSRKKQSFPRTYCGSFIRQIDSHEYNGIYQMVIIWIYGIDLKIIKQICWYLKLIHMTINNLILSNDNHKYTALKTM